MDLRIAMIAAVLCGAPAATTMAQALPPTNAASQDESAATETAPSLEGLWPSPKLMNAMLGRWADMAVNEFDLDEEQAQRVHEETVRRWSEFFNENRAKIQPVANEFLELRMELTPPSKESVQDWAGRAIPVFESFRAELARAQDGLRKELSPLQRAKFEFEVMQFGVGLNYAAGRLKQWESGEFDPKDFWEPTRSDPEARAERRRERRERWSERRRAREEHEAALKAAQSRDQIELEMTAWEAFVADFIKRYRLDDGQKTTATSCLAELRLRAADHRDRHREDIAKLEARIHDNSGTEQELDAIREQLVELYGPIDEMFLELKTRLEAIPTAQQRAAAEVESADPAKQPGRPKPTDIRPDRPVEAARPQPADQPATTP